jgi:hypothetical protein
MNNQTTTPTATNLEAKVLALNLHNEKVLQIFNHEQNELKKYVGTNPLKIDGSFKAKIKHSKLEPYQEICRSWNKINVFGLDWWTDTNYYFSVSYGRFTANIKSCLTGGGTDRAGHTNKYCIYETTVIDLFNIDEKGNFQPLKESQRYEARPVFEVAKLREAAQEIKAIANEYRCALNSLPYEFHNVLNIERLTR